MQLTRLDRRARGGGCPLLALCSLASIPGVNQRVAHAWRFASRRARKRSRHPHGSTPERFQLIAPYETDSRRWLKIGWIDRYSGNTYRIRTTGDHGTRGSARVKTYGDVIEEYEFHPGRKCADARGQPSGKQTVGLLQRRHVRIDSISAIGKESNNLEEVEAGLAHDEQNVYTVYTDPRRDYWSREVVSALKNMPLNVWERESGGKSRRILIDARLGRRRPHRRNQELLISVARKLSLL